MNDKKQIEELASLMADCSTTCDECFNEVESVMTLPIQKRENYCQVYAYAQRAVEQGYQKLPEDSVVLTKAEIERLHKRNKELTSIAGYQQNSNMKRWKIIKEKEKENAELQKQINKAKEQFLFTCENCHLKKDIELLQYQKEQAAKEFAEKIKAHAERCYDWAVAKIVSEEVDNVLGDLLKEYEK